jgi:5,10-methylenetetrahydromethanopterin reductase
MVEFWKSGSGNLSVEAIRAAENEGWDGHTFQDSLSLCPNVFALMGAAAVATERLMLATGVTNPLTRHIALVASGAAGVQALSSGRAVLGIGRGGLAPVSLGDFERALTDLQTLLSGGKIEAPLFNGPTGLEWLPKHLPKVPLDAVASGPKVIEVAAPLVERLTFSLGAIPERIAWGIGIARSARARAGPTAKDLSYGAQIAVICHPERQTAEQIAASMVPALARFQLIQGRSHGTMSEEDKQNFESLGQMFAQMRGAGSSAAKNLTGNSITPEFVRRFAIVGPPDDCIARLLELVNLGIRRFVIVGPGHYPEAYSHGPGLFASEVMPAIKAAARP